MPVFEGCEMFLPVPYTTTLLQVCLSIVDGGQWTAIRMLRDSGCDVQVRKAANGREVSVSFSEGTYNLETVLLLRKIPSLESLSLSDIRNLGDAVHVFKGLKTLQRLSIRDCPLTDDVCDELRLLPDVRVLRLCSTRSDGQSLNWVSQLKSLKLLFISEEVLEPNSLISLAQLERLEVLYLVDCKIADIAAEHIAKWPEIKLLSLQRTDIGDKTLEGVTQLKHLLRVNLDNTRITDKGLAMFMARRPRELKSISVKGTKVSAACITKLREGYPGVVLDDGS